jgi:hypothetical protein
LSKRLQTYEASKRTQIDRTWQLAESVETKGDILHGAGVGGGGWGCVPIRLMLCGNICSGQPLGLVISDEGPHRVLSWTAITQVN